MVAANQDQMVPGRVSRADGRSLSPAGSRVRSVVLIVTCLLVIGAILATRDALGLDSRFVDATLAVGLMVVVVMLVAGLRDLSIAEARTRAALTRAFDAETAQRARADELASVLAEVKRVQQQLVQASKLGAVGELAAVVAHEVNNPLTGILGFAELLITELPQDDPRREEAIVIRDEAVRARTIVKALLEFSRPRPPQRLSTDLTDLTRSTLELVRFRAQEMGVRIVEYFAELPCLEVDPDAMKQVLLNLFNNAFQAMPHGGELRVATLLEAGRVGLVVRDTGEGMDAGTLKRIFTPFFSTRSAAGTGTGLGLSVSLQIVEGHGGTIEVMSEPGRGAAFTVWLPLSWPSFAGDAIVPGGGASVTGGNRVHGSEAAA